MEKVELDDSLLDRIQSAVRPGDTILTLASKRQNIITAIGREGVWVETLRSDSRRAGPQLVPAWMIATAWRRLTEVGTLSNTELLNNLNVKRSSFVIGLLAEFPDVVVRSTRPIVIERINQSPDRRSGLRGKRASEVSPSPVGPRRYVPRRGKQH